MYNHYYAVIMAGGGGTRLWPLSRQSRPKQMLSLSGGKTLFQMAVERLKGIFPPDRIYVVTVETQAHELQAQCSELPSENFLIEPMPRGTASVVGLAAVALQKRDPQAVMAILTADHFIGNEERFLHLLRTALDVTRDGFLVTLGIEPTYPATGYGYIQQGEQIGSYNDLCVYRVARFKEKPDETTARQMLASGNYAWNSGMFVWRVDLILAEMTRQMPELVVALQKIGAVWGKANQGSVVGQIWPGLKSETIDYGIMENAQQVAVIPAAELEWSDVGSWDSLFDLLPGDEHGNIVMGARHLGLETYGSLIHGNQDGRLIVTIGVDDLVVVDTGDVLFVCRKDQAQQVRQVVNQLRDLDQSYL